MNAEGLDRPMSFPAWREAFRQASLASAKAYFDGVFFFRQDAESGGAGCAAGGAGQDDMMDMMRRRGDGQERREVITKRE